MITNLPPDFPVEAYQSLVTQVWHPVFLQKLARDWSEVPASSEEEEQLQEIAGLIRRLQVEEQTKQASAGGLITEACDGLKTALARRGYPQQPLNRDRVINKMASDALEQVPGLGDAALTYGNYLSSLQASVS